MIVSIFRQDPYAKRYAAMLAFAKRVNERGAYFKDELWVCEHLPVFTLGISGKREHILNAGEIPICATNRGGQVTYHGTGQLTAYPLLCLARYSIRAREYVFLLENVLIRVLAELGITGHRFRGAPGVYIKIDDAFGHSVLQPEQHPHFQGLAKIAAIGIKISRYVVYHGFALNIATDLEAFKRINPCGHPGLVTTDLASLGIHISWEQVTALVVQKLEISLEALLVH